MRTVGLIGGMSWESTTTYYTLINRGINSALGKSHSAKILLYSFDFQRIEELQLAGDWLTLKKRIVGAGQILKRAGADLIVLCTNTMHKVAGDFEKQVGIPLIHIADAVGQTVVEQGIKTIGLLGTTFTMEERFYKEILEEQYQLTVVIPEKVDREAVNSIIYNELVRGIVSATSKDRYFDIMDKLTGQGAQGIILGCTEIGLLITTYKAPLIDSTIVHARAAVERMLK